MKYLLAKVAIIGILALSMLIPVQMVRSLVNERMERRNELIQQMGQVWGSPQTLTGAYLHHKDRVVYPDEVTISGEIIPDVRKKGIFTLPFYSTRLNIKGSFARPVNTSVYRRIAVTMTDAASAKVNYAKWGSEKSNCSHWLASKDSIMINIPEKNDGNNSFEVDLTIQGIDSLLFLPLARKTNIHLASQWEDPNFTGAFLPLTRDVSGTGFDATWSVESGKVSPSSEGASFGVNLFIPVDIYTLTDRATKYAVLFITLTFLTFFLFEILNRIRIHPLQYLLVGLALSIFYLLLLSLSEQIGFTVSYFIATAAVVALISWYCLKALRSTRRSVITGTLIAVLYIFLYALLRMETYALLIGSLGLFAILASIMYLTRDVDWYSLQNGIKPGLEEK